MTTGRDDEPRFLYPHLLFEILCVAIVVIEAVTLLALLFPPPILRQVNFAFPFSPKPAWYFLPLYELVKYFPGRFIFLGASVIPMLFFLLLYAVPWLDGSSEVKIGRRRWAAAAAMGAAAVILTLLWQGWRA